MAGTYKIFGANVPKNAVYIGGGIFVVGAIYFYRKNKASQAQQASVAQAGGTTIDPATGYPYGSPEDAAALDAQNQYQLPGSSGVGFSGGGGFSSTFGSGAPGSFSTNAEWAQYVEAYEVNNLGADAGTVGNSIGKYLTGQPLTSDMVGLVQSAIAIGGYPPVSGTNGNPPNFVTSGGSPGTGGTNPTPPPTNVPPPNTNPGGPAQGANVKVPNANGKSAGTAHNLIVKAQLVPIADPNQKPSDKVIRLEPASGTSVPTGTRILIVAKNKQGQIT